MATKRIAEVAPAVTPSCRACRWWTGPRGDAAYSGNCRRLPPRPTTGVVGRVWPTTQSTDWCGEFAKV